MKHLFFLLSLLLVINLYSHGSASSINSNNEYTNKIIFPDIEDGVTVISDLHTHSVFSDGHVWPNIRVEEAIRNGLDLIAITEHLEYQPHIDDIPHPDRNKSFYEAKNAAKNKEIIVINGSEITREFPPGHINAIFINDANKLLNIDYGRLDEANKYIETLPEDIKETYAKQPWFTQAVLANLWSPVEALKIAKTQGAFTFWNHPAWSEESRNSLNDLTEMHREMIDSNLLDGIEVVNGNHYSEEAFKVALVNNLTLIGTSDVHDLIDWDYPSIENKHRPVTLIFAKNKTKDSIKEALLNDKTAIWWKNTLLAKPKNMQSLLKVSIIVDKVKHLVDQAVTEVTLVNRSDVGFNLQNIDSQTFDNAENIIHLPPHGKIKLGINDYDDEKGFYLKFKVLNALTAPRINPVISL
tara:strand:- start:238 stop:1470 length:1233 start_codon:yes stop_codon:yes gene_type:complete